jgi:hypothetical protein
MVGLSFVYLALAKKTGGRLLTFSDVARLAARFVVHGRGEINRKLVGFPGLSPLVAGSLHLTARPAGVRKERDLQCMNASNWPRMDCL